MKMEIIRLPDVAIVRCTGRITHGPEARRLQETLAQLLVEHRQCVLNLAAVTQVDAGGLGTLAELARQARAWGAGLSLANVNGQVREALRLTGLDEVLEIYTSEQAAVEARAAA